MIISYLSLSNFLKGNILNKSHLHHLATAIAFAFLITWYYLLNSYGFFEYFSELTAQQYQGAGLMLGIAIGMTPAFFIWSRFNRWVEKKLDIKGIYYEDGFYKDDEKGKDKN
jgi:hypothetical protein